MQKEQTGARAAEHRRGSRTAVTSQGGPEFTVGPYVRRSSQNIHAQHPQESFAGR